MSEGLGACDSEVVTGRWTARDVAIGYEVMRNG